MDGCKLDNLWRRDEFRRKLNDELTCIFSALDERITRLEATVKTLVNREVERITEEQERAQWKRLNEKYGGRDER